MSTKLADLAKKTGITVDKLKAKIKEFGFEVAPKARTIDDETAELISNEISKKTTKKEEKIPVEDFEPILDVDKKPEDIAEIYDEIIGEKQDREIVKSQRKKTAGKDLWKDKKHGKGEAVQQVEQSDTVKISDHITVKEFAEKTGIKIARVIGELMKNGILANINQEIDFETAQILADDMGIKLERIRSVVSTEDLMAGDISNLLKEDDSSLLVPRPPVICVMGHVDHGKTKLLDAIRKTDVVSGESGGITQHIGAYQVVKNGRPITFLDTPGHEAFTAMRARGAKATDIAVLVVAADEGVKPQTVEAINHAKEAGVPIIVALNKMDKPGINLDKVKAELSEQGLQAEDWGGKTVMVPVSALKGDGVQELLDLILLTADMLDLKANPNREAVGTVIESHLDNSLGPISTVLINTGTLHVSDNVIIGSTYGRVKLMRDHNKNTITFAGPSTPVLIAGLASTPKSGDILQVVESESKAKLRAEEVSLRTKQRDQEKLSGLNQVISNVKSDKILKIVLKADTKGSLEAIRQSIAKIKDEEVAVKVIHGGVGTITESDILMASASRGVVFGFHTDFDSPAVKKSAEHEGVEVRSYMVIYSMLEDVRKILSGLLEPEYTEVVLGRAKVHQIFFTKRNDSIIGCKITNGKIEVKTKARIFRKNATTNEEEMVGEGFIDSLKKVSEAVKELKEGNDCGIKFNSNMKLEEGDVLESYKNESKQRMIA